MTAPAAQFDPMSLFALPSKAPRLPQADAIRCAFAAFEAGKRFVVLEAPPGSGKSAVAVTLARTFGRAYINTLTKSLQEQYLTTPDFRPFGLMPLKGRSAYHCDRAGDTCETGGVMYRGEDVCKECPYRNARDAAMLAPVAVCNYHSYLAVMARGMEGGQGRELMVLDECTEAERVLMEWASVEIRYGALPLAPDDEPPERGQGLDAYWEWVEAYAEQLGLELEHAGDGDYSPRDVAAMERLHQRLSTALWAKERERFVVEPDSDGGGFALRPVTVGSLGSVFFSRAKRVLLMSGTILDLAAFCRSLGIKRDEAAYIAEPCTFPKENRTVAIGNLDMTKPARGRSWPAMVPKVERILQHHRHEKGLLLTPSNEMLQFLARELPLASRSRLIMAFGKDREKQLARHMRGNAPTVLAASGMWEGVDLEGDSSRFQILPALPRPFLSPQVRARMDLEPGWYRWRTVLRFIQGAMRSVRSDSDRAFTYVFDRDLRAELERRDSLVPAWVKEACVYSHGS